MKQTFLLLVILALFATQNRLHADEGMWIPILLNRNIDEMQKMGWKLTQEDIYSINHSSLKDAIVRFGGGCTGEVVSANGLLLTNHHCGYGAIQRHSTLDHDYLTDGFWAASFAEELPNPGLTVTFLIRMEDVTAQVLDNVTTTMKESERMDSISKHIEAILKQAEKDTHYKAFIRPFYEGNQYYLFVTEVFKDIRLVGAPPSGIGKFGGDTDNWMWPRHTGDFSVFRIYADSNNLPADYSIHNVPYKPKYYLPVSIAGYDPGDFTLLFGNPGTTNEYLPSVAVEAIALQENPVKIRLRGKRLEIIGQAQESNRLIRIQYASKHAGIANYWKKMIGETRGIKRAGTVEKKRSFENDFQTWALDRSGTSECNYTGILPLFDSLYNALSPLSMASIYLREAGSAPEILSLAAASKELVTVSGDKTATKEQVDQAVNNLVKTARGFYKNYNPNVDEKIMKVMLDEMGTNMDPLFRPDIFSFIDKHYKGDIDAYVTDLYSRSLFADSSNLYPFLEKYRKNHRTLISRDPAYQQLESISIAYRNRILPGSRKIMAAIDSLQRIYMKAQMEMQPDKRFYPDANSTMRVCYGQVSGFEPADAVSYRYFTTTQGILEKEDSTIYDYKVDQRLKDLIRNNDFGRYADQDGTMHVAFISTIHSTGGNSGAPVLNGSGELIGLNFDRNWEGTMSDLHYDPDQCRNIVLDIRYLLFIMDKYAGASRLVEEMDIREL